MICNPLLKNCLQSEDPTAYTNNVIQSIFSLFFIVGVIYFIWHFIMAGYHFISNEGDPKRIEVAKNELTFSIVGLAVIFSVFAALKFIGAVFGIQGLDALQITWPTL